MPAGRKQLNELWIGRRSRTVYNLRLTIDNCQLKGKSKKSQKLLVQKNIILDFLIAIF